MKRFYRDVTVTDTDGGHCITLDGRALKTQGGAAQRLPTRSLADALAQEWANQGPELDPAGFAGRDMADYAIDVIAPDPAAIADKLLPYAETDTLCYRADPDAPLLARQTALWDPVLDAFEAREGVRMIRVSGVLHKPQPAATLATLRARLAGLDAFTLAALEQTTTLAHSLVIGLSALEPGADVTVLWNAANLEEDWQVELWGSDHEAAARRERRRIAFAAAVDFARRAAA